MNLHHKQPCNECPWRKAAAAGWLGGWSPEFYADAVAANEVPACHMNDHGPDNPKTSMCAGALSVMANACISADRTEGGNEARAEVGRRDDTFAHPAKFYEHHAGREYTPYILREMKA